MPEDAPDPNEIILPHSMESNPLKIKDPRKKLVEWLDQRGEELKFEYEETSEIVGSSFSRMGTPAMVVARCTLPLSSDGLPDYVALGRGGKKKEAEQKAIRDAVQFLQREGLLQESGSIFVAERARMKALLGDSDGEEDDFFDRTRSTHPATPRDKETVDTLESLVVKRETMQTQVMALEATIEALERDLHGNDSAEDDELDHYMKGLEQNEKKMKLTRLKKEKTTCELESLRLEKLIDLVTPANGAKSGTSSSSPHRSPVKMKLHEMENEHDGDAPPKKKARAEPARLSPAPSSQLAQQAKPGLPGITESSLEEWEKSCDWVPPTNQRGDGRTNLNEKYGY
jgi:hypothetical protein